MSALAPLLEDKQTGPNNGGSLASALPAGALARRLLSNEINS